MRYLLLLLIAAVALLVSGPAQAQELAAGWDFIPGEKLLLYDDFTDMSKGASPPHWAVRGGSVKLRADGKLLVSEDVKLLPNVTTWPKNFTIEQEFILEKGETDRVLTWWFGDDDWQWKVTLNCEDGEMVCIVRLDSSDELGLNKAAFKHGQPNMLNIWMQDERIRIYFNQQRLIDVNQVKVAPWKGATLEMRPFEAPIVLSRFRIAESSPDFSKTILSSGRFVTHGIQFDVNSDRLRPESAPVLKMVAEALAAQPALKPRIEGHTDSSGDAAKNLDLSKRRAESVKNALVTGHGIAADRLTTEGLGQTKPLSPNDTPQGRANNRRVEFARI